METYLHIGCNSAGYSNGEEEIVPLARRQEGLVGGMARPLLLLHFLFRRGLVIDQYGGVDMSGHA